MVDDLLAQHPGEIPTMRKIIDDAIVLYTRPYQYHNAIHMLTTLAFAFDRAIRVNELGSTQTDIVERMRNVITMVAYHDTGNRNAPRPNGIDETEASDHFLAAINAASEGDPLYVYKTPEGIQDRNVIVAALLGSLFRERFVSAEAMRADMATLSPRYNYVRDMAVKLGISADELAGLIADNKYSKLMRNADISSSLWTQRLKNLFLNYWEDLQRPNSPFAGQNCTEYDNGFKAFITGRFAGQTDDAGAVAAANEGRPMLVVPGIPTDTNRDSVTLQEAGEYVGEIFTRHAPFINLVFSQFNLVAGEGLNARLVSQPLTEVFACLRELRQRPEELKRILLKKNGRTDASAEELTSAITTVDLTPYEQRMSAAHLENKCWAQLTENDLCTLLGEQVPPAYEFASSSAAA